MDLLQVFQRSEGAIIALQNPLFALEKTKAARAMASIGRRRQGFENLYLGKASSFCGIRGPIGWQLFWERRHCADRIGRRFSPNLNHPQLESFRWLCWDHRSFSNPR
jgi:hypothetical protein